MKFSVLLPTRNRLEYLRYAVETVRRQDYDDWEIVISDNFSEDDIAGYVAALDDERIRYFRTESFVPVTENWNNALERSTGDYVIMLGDDDCLMKGYFTTIRRLVEEFEQPDFIYTSAYLYAYPGVMPEWPEGFLQPYGYAPFLAPGVSKIPYLLTRKQAHELVTQFMDFRVSYGFNMQFSVVRRKFIDSLRDKGQFFQSPFPDYYASNVMFLKAERILVCPYPLVTIGVTPKSYGFFYNNQREGEGIEFLNSAFDPATARRLEHILLPGTNINTSWLFSAETVKANYGSEFPLRVSYGRYRFLQMAYVYEHFYAHKRLSKENLRELKSQMRLWEKLVIGYGISTLMTVKRIISPSRREKIYLRLRSLLKQLPEWRTEVVKHKYDNILEVFEQVNPLQS